MTSLLVAKQYIKKFYAKFEVYLIPLMKFLLSLISLLLINRGLGFMERINDSTVVLVAALMCSFMPMNFIVVIAAGFCAAACVCIVVGMHNRSTGSFYADVPAVFQVFAERYRCGSSDSDLFSAAYSVYHSDCIGSALHTGIGSVGGLRDGGILSADLCEQQRNCVVFDGNRRGYGKVPFHY